MAVTIGDGSLKWVAEVDTTRLKQQTEDINNQLTGVAKKVNQEAAAIDGFARKAAGALTAFLSVNVASNFLNSIIDVRAQFQKLEAVLTNALGDKSEAQKALQQVSDYVANTPFQLEEVSSAYVKLVNQGIRPAKEELTAIGDLAASQGKGFDQLVEAIIDAQTGEFERLKEFGIRATKEGDKVAFTFKGVKTQVDFTSEAIVGYVQGLGKLQGVTGATAAISATLGGQISNLRDAFTNMLNDIGKSGEDVFGGTISALTFLVKNFQTVIDVIKVLIATYGAYRAALIVTNAAMIVAKDIQNGLTLAQSLHTRAILIGQKAMAFFNNTLLKSPIALVVAALAGLVAALTIFGKKATEAEKKQKLLNDVSKDAQKIIIEEKSVLEDLLKVARDETQSKENREAAIRRLNAISPEYLGNLTLENLKTQEGIAIVDNYIKALDRKALAQAINAKKQKLFDEQIDLQDQFDKLRKLPGIAESQSAFDSKVVAALKGKLLSIKESINENETAVESLNEKYKETLASELLGDEKKIKSKERTLAVIDAEIKAEKDKQTNFSKTSAEYQKFQTAINKLEEERKRITGATKSEIKSENSEQDKSISLLEKRKDLLDQIAEKIKDSQEPNKTKQQEELEQINKSYDILIDNVAKFNAEIEIEKKNNPKKHLEGIGQAFIDNLNKARMSDLDNVFFKDDAERFKKSLDEKKILFEQYEDAKKEIGVEKAKELFGEQTKDFVDFLEVLKDQAALLQPKFELGIETEGDRLKMTAINEFISAQNKKRAEDDLKREIGNYKELINAVEDFNKERIEITDKYNKLEDALRKDTTIKDKKTASKILKERMQEELELLENNISRQSPLYRKLSLDLINFTRKNIKALIKELENVLRNDRTITPQMKADIKSAVDQYKSLLKETNLTAESFSKAAEGLLITSNVFGQLADSVSEFDQSLGNVLQQISDVAKIGEDAANAFVAFSTGDVAGGITSAANAIQGIIEGFVKAAKSAKDAKQAIIDFRVDILAGEAEYDLLIRDRQRNEVKAHKLKMQGLEDEKKLLEEQRKISLQAYDDVLKKLQSESFISGQKTKKKRGSPLTGILGFFSGTRTEVENELSSLAGKTFEELERLFTSGQLTDSARKLFEQLQKIKAEGVDIDRLLEENKLQVQQLFTGTTAESISDSIISGLEQGKRGVADFADNFEDLMKQAFLNSLKFKYLEGPIQSFFEDFAAASESDGQLTSGEIDRLKTMYNSIITNAADQFEQLQQVAGINFNTDGGTANTLTGAIRGMTEQQADLLAGQFGGVRISIIEQNRIAMRGIESLQQIEFNTARLIPMFDLWRRIELNGLKVI